MVTRIATAVRPKSGALEDPEAVEGAWESADTVVRFRKAEVEG